MLSQSIFFAIFLLQAFFTSLSKPYQTTKVSYFTKPQWKKINSMIQNNKTTPAQRLFINRILFERYNIWALYKAYQFKQFHQYKCSHIPLNELQLYSSHGLLKAIQHYNGFSNFAFYANIYIQGELYKGLTDLFPLSIRPKQDRKKNRNKQKGWYPTQFIGKDDWILDKYNLLDSYDPLQCRLEKEEYEAYWQKIDDLPACQKRVLYYKYDFYFNKIRTNLQIAKLMICSEEKVRLLCVKALQALID